MSGSRKRKQKYYRSTSEEKKRDENRRGEEREGEEGQIMLKCKIR